jgi:hypothetical protein
MTEEELYKTKQEVINYFSSDSYMLNVAVDVIDNNIELLRENKQLQNNWNELKNYISKKLKDRICDELYYEAFFDMNIKMKELEGNK